jgi:spore germination cell wall hydrolase CwlJ-like protein
MASDLMTLLSGQYQVPELQKTAIEQISDDIIYKEKARAELARVIAAEGASEGEKGMRAIASTIMNRSNSSGKTPLDIVTAKNQYYGYTAPNKEKLYGQVKDIADAIANDLIEGRLEDITNGAEYFLLPNEKVRSWHGDRTKTIGKHTFYKEAKRK